MRLLGTSHADRELLDRRLGDAGHVVAIALCAAWCTTCREFRAACEGVAQARPDASIVWIDVEDDEALVGDLDIETFPTLAVFEGERLRHFGATLPRVDLVLRLLLDAASLSAADAPEDAHGLVRALRQAAT
jgi:thioredoxin reductase (NADPH)